MKVLQAQKSERKQAIRSAMINGDSSVAETFARVFTIPTGERGTRTSLL